MGFWGFVQTFEILNPLEMQRKTGEKHIEIFIAV